MCMKAIFVDCPTGIAGDMLLAAFLDLGVPKKIIEEPLSSIGLGNTFSLRIKEANSLGIRGIRVFVEESEKKCLPIRLHEIISIIENTNWSESLREKVLNVFTKLAEAESSVHGEPVDKVHFHELGSLDALVEVVSICAIVEHFDPIKIYCSIPPAGSGTVQTSHGLLPVPVPVVLELAKRNKIQLAGGNDFPKGELTTPTGLALMAVLVDEFSQPSYLDIEAIGIGLGHRSFDRPNLLRVSFLKDNNYSKSINTDQGLHWETLVLQETWIDDATPEDISILMDELRRGGAVEVISHSILMKKGRQGICVKAIVSSEKAEDLRLIWLSKGTTIGIREYSTGRWILPRRSGICSTSLGDIRVKEVRRPDGSKTIKPEHDELVRISIETGESIEAIRREVFRQVGRFSPKEEWST